MVEAVVVSIILDAYPLVFEQVLYNNDGLLPRTEFVDVGMRFTNGGGIGLQPFSNLENLQCNLAGLGGTTYVGHVSLELLLQYEQVESAKGTYVRGNVIACYPPFFDSLESM
jgi:hypothetical protein